MSAILGIDPGKTGALARISQSGSAEVIDMPLIGSEIDVRALATWLRVRYQTAIAILEYQQSMPKQGVASVFNLAEGYGMLKGLLYGLGIRTEIVRPTAWKKALGIPAGADKDVSRELAARLFPNVNLTRKKDHGRAEALLIAEWGRRQTWNGGAGDDER